MGRTLWRGMGVLVSLGLTLPAMAQAPAPASPDATPADEATVDIPLPHVSRVNGDGAVVQRDVDEAEAVAGEHLAFGDRVTTGAAQVQLVWSDGSVVGLDRETSLAVLSPALLALTSGRALIVTPAAATEPLRVDTPAGSFTVAPGTEVRATLRDAVADVQVAHGSVDVEHAAGDVTVAAGQQVTLRDGTAPGTVRTFNTAAFDSFVAWAREPVLAARESPSRAYLGDPRLEAYADVFDRHGQWEENAVYGYVWYPTVAAAWRPYSHGYWQPFAGAYGPTWVGLDPWGWPTHHYGHWDVGKGDRWFWRPGRRWSPGRVHWSVGPGYVGWSPLGLRGTGQWAWTAPRASQRGVYPGGTLDPFRAWTVIPTERYGMRGGLSAYAVDARTLTNLDAFVTQRTAPPLRIGGTSGWGWGSSYGRSPVLRYPGSGYRGGDTTHPGGRIPPTRIGPAGSPAVGPTPPPDNPYERANEVMTPRGRQRAPEAAPPARQPASREAAPQRAPAPRRSPSDARPPQQRQDPPSAASTPSTPPATAEAPPARGLDTRRPTSRHAVPRPHRQ